MASQTSDLCLTGITLLSFPSLVSICVYICPSAVADDGPEIFLSPAVTYGPPGLDLSCPIAMTVAHCAEGPAENWIVRLKRQMQDNKWEVSLPFFFSLNHHLFTSTFSPVLMFLRLQDGELVQTSFSRISLQSAKLVRLPLMKIFHREAQPCEHGADFRVASSDSSLDIKSSLFGSTSCCHTSKRNVRANANDAC